MIAKSAAFTFHAFGLQKIQLDLFSKFQTLKYVKPALIHAFPPLKTSFVPCF